MHRTSSEETCHCIRYKNTTNDIKNTIYGIRYAQNIIRRNKYVTAFDIQNTTNDIKNAIYGIRCSQNIIRRNMSMHTIYKTLHTIYKLYIRHTLCTEHYQKKYVTAYDIKTLHTILKTLYTTYDMHHTAYCIHHTPYDSLYTIYDIRHASHYVHHTTYDSLHTTFFMRCIHVRFLITYFGSPINDRCLYIVVKYPRQYCLVFVSSLR